jgi:hypothetical protein
MKQEYISECVTKADESNNNIKWQTPQHIIMETADEVVGKAARTENSEWYKEDIKNQNEAC